MYKFLPILTLILFFGCAPSNKISLADSLESGLSEAEINECIDYANNTERCLIINSSGKIIDTTNIKTIYFECLRSKQKFNVKSKKEWDKK